MMPVILVAGVQGSGKSWVCRQLTDKFRYVPHDRCWTHPLQSPGEGLDAAWGAPGSKSTHVPEILRAATESTLPVLTEAPFGERQLRDELTKAGLKVSVVFIVEDASTLTRRFRNREGKSLPDGALTRAAGLQKRAIDWGCFWGSSEQVLQHLKGKSKLTVGS
jgi:gluconate kinase